MQRVGGLSYPVMVDVLRGSLSVRQVVRLSWFALPSLEQLRSSLCFNGKAWLRQTFAGDGGDDDDSPRQDGGELNHLGPWRLHPC